MPSDRPILRLPEARRAERVTGKPRNSPQPRGPGRRRQGERLGASFSALQDAVRRAEGGVEVAEDPTGVAPERALVFETAGSIQDFARAAREAGLELIVEVELDETEDIPEGFEPPQGREKMGRTLYATMPTLRSAGELLRLWNAHQKNEAAPYGLGPWWKLFDQLVSLRAWGPDDRLPEDARDAILKQLEGKADDEGVKIEIEIWPSAIGAARERWRGEVEAKIRELAGTIVDRSSISGQGFVYEAVLASLPAASVRALLDAPATPGGLGTVRGVQFILPQALGEALPQDGEDLDRSAGSYRAFGHDTPVRAALFDGTPVAAHPALDGGVVIEDVHDLVRRSVVHQRFHATSMASLILRGDLEADGVPMKGSRLVSVPLLVDADDRGGSPSDRLFVDLVHVALTRLLSGADALAPDVFVINMSIGMPTMRFGGRISALARLIDWWAHQHGVLFVIAAGNIKDELLLENVETGGFIATDVVERGQAVRQSLHAMAYARRLTCPADALNGLTVGAISEDRAEASPVPRGAGIVSIDAVGSRYPAIGSAVGLGPLRAIKPDVLECGGAHEVRASADGVHTKISVAPHPHAGLVVASPRFDAVRGTRRSCGTSCAAALTTRAIVQSATALLEAGGPFDGQLLPRRDLALLTRTLAVNAADWSDEALAHYEACLTRFGPYQSLRAKEEVARHFGYGYLSTLRMMQSPAGGVTFVGLGDIRKDGARIFDIPLPPSLSGERVPRSMRVTLAWFSPVNGARARYRLASLHAIAADMDDEGDEDRDTGWGLLLKADGPDDRMIRRGTVWSRRLQHARLAAPAYDAGQSIPLRVQCQDASNGGLDPDLSIRFALAVTLEVESEVQYDIHQECQAGIRQRV